MTMTPEEERAHLVYQLQQIAQGTLQEWMRIVDLEDVAGIPFQARANWQDHQGSMILGENRYGDEYGAFQVTVSVTDLGPLPPIGPECDPAQIEELAAGRRHRFQGHEGSPWWSEGNACDRPEGDRVHIEEAAEDDPQWVTRTWADVRPGDRVRLPGTEHVAEVESAIGIDHVMHPNGRSAAGWREIKVRLAGRADLLPMDPDAAIEIELTPSEVAAIEALGGWGSRVRMEI